MDCLIGWLLELLLLLLLLLSLLLLLLLSRDKHLRVRCCNRMLHPLPACSTTYRRIRPRFACTGA
jgi:hypothetical protein